MTAENNALHTTRILRVSVNSLIIVFYSCTKASAEAENEVKRGVYPYMAFLYYPDEAVVDSTGSRFLRGAVLIRLDWLVSSAIDSAVPEEALSKTLLARVGAIRIDANMTFNEDEEEQEQEVIQIVRPYSHNRTLWWITDIVLLKTLMPFKSTSAVTVTRFPNKRDYAEKPCIILLFNKISDKIADGRVLSQLPVELLPASDMTCGEHFDNNTMTCAADTEEKKNAKLLPDYCQGCSGGPLICEDEVMGLQTYLNGNCLTPHLYQLLTPWEIFITCGTEGKCDQEQCLNTCSITLKDVPETTTTSTADPNLTKELEFVDNITRSTTIAEEELTTPVNEITTTSPEITTTTTTVTTVRRTTVVVVVTTENPPKRVVANKTKSWPNERDKNRRKLEDLEEGARAGRKPTMEAQLAQAETTTETPNILRGSVDKNVFVLQNLIFTCFIVMCVM